MSATDTDTEGGATDQLGDARRELQTARAAELARAGHREEALRLLEQQGPDHPAAELDLMARIQAQRGRFDEAEALWSRAAESPGSDPETYRGRRERVAALQRRGARSSRLRRVAVLAVLAVLLLALLAGLIVWRVVRDDGRDAEVAGLRAQQDQVSRQLAEARNVPPPPPARPTLPADLRSRLIDDGLESRPRPDGSLLVLLPGVPFAVEGSELSPQARTSLDALGRTLGPLAPRVDVRVTGHAVGASDAKPSDPGGANTALARAITATGYLATASGIPVGDIDSTSAGAADPPFPTTPEAENERNRTVTVTITPTG